MQLSSRKLSAVCTGCAIALLSACSPQDRSAAGESGSPATEARQSPMKPGAIDTVERKIDDGMITAKVKSALLTDSTVKGTKIDVDTKGGTVTLSGTAASEAEKEKAEKLAAAVEGVKRVVNRISIG